MEPENFVCSPFTQLGCRTSAKGRVEADLRSLISDLFYCGDGDEAGDGCSEMSGVAVGEGLEDNGDAPAGVVSFNEDGTCINESKESLAAVGDGVGVGEAFSCAGLGCGFVAVASM
jgi:hypothetical protein